MKSIKTLAVLLALTSSIQFVELHGMAQSNKQLPTFKSEPVAFIMNYYIRPLIFEMEKKSSTDKAGDIVKVSQRLVVPHNEHLEFIQRKFSTNNGYFANGVRFAFDEHDYGTLLTLERYPLAEKALVLDADIFRTIEEKLTSE